MTENLFDLCRAIPAGEAARREGLRLKRSGKREWACCPFHGEKTPSLMFDEKGYFHCFGCGAHGGQRRARPVGDAARRQPNEERSFQANHICAVNDNSELRTAKTISSANPTIEEKIRQYAKYL